MASKKSKIVGKDDLKRLMKEQKSSSLSKEKKIDSPLACTGQLSCVICQCPVKNSLLWPAHVQGRTHKENVERLKSEKQQRDEIRMMPPPPASGTKRKHSSVSNKPAKHHKGNTNPSQSPKESLPSDFFDSEVGKSKERIKKPKSILKNGPANSSAQTSSVLAEYSSSSSDDEDDRQVAPPSASAASTSASAALPADFFDSGVTPSEDLPKTTDHSAMAEQLPEGFFDDPKLDAKVRQVEFKDKMDEEWELFQRAMKEETHVSEAIMDEEDEVVTAERNIKEIDDQLHRWSQINELEKRKEELMHKEGDHEAADEKDESDEAEDEEAEFDEFLDWRSKNAWK